MLNQKYINSKVTFFYQPQEGFLDRLKKRTPFFREVQICYNLDWVFLEYFATEEDYKNYELMDNCELMDDAK